MHHVLRSVPVDDATLVHQSMPLKLWGVADRTFTVSLLLILGPFSQTHYAYTVCVPIGCQVRLFSIGPREDESVSVMRLEKKSSIHNSKECVCDAMQHGKCSPCPFFGFFLFSSPSATLLSRRSMSARVPVRHFPTVHCCAEDGG